MTIHGHGIRLTDRHQSAIIQAYVGGQSLQGRKPVECGKQCNLVVVTTLSGTRRIGLTLGDPSGIGPEIVAAAIGRATDAVRRRLIVYGDGPILERALAQVTGERMPPDIEIVDRGVLSADQAVPGRPSEAGARAQVGYLEAAVRGAKSQTIAGLVTAPISKRAAKKAGFEFPGHTEFLAARLGAEQFAMMFAGPSVNAVLATTHIALAEVSAHLTVAGLTATIVLAAEAMIGDFAVSPVHVGVLGLNPHAGEGGQFGREEIEVVTPAIEEARRQLGDRGQVSGPLVPDVAFRLARDRAYDVVVALYHDQGLIPVKLLDFDRAVNVTLGLPIVRTSPDHGVAYDIAGTGKARPDSFCAALDLAVSLVDRRGGHR